MRNLRIASMESRQLGLSLPEERLACAAFDASRGHIIFATSSSSLVCFANHNKEAIWTLSLCSGNDLVKDKVVGLEFLLDNEVLAVGTGSGELFSVSVISQSIEVVGNVEGGIVQMSASPDGELLAVATGLGMLLVMTSDWEVFYEIPLDVEIPSEKSNNGCVNPATELVCISWRADGKYFATLGSSANFGSAKELRIWERDTGTLHASSKVFSSTSLVLDWVPNGSRLATVRSAILTEQTAEVVFYERNGLERGSFDLPGAVGARVGYIRWNCNSELFAVLLKCSGMDAIQIWSCSNYHWYLKQEWRYFNEDNINFGWDPESPMQIFTWTRSGLVQLVNLCWDSAVIVDSVALVIDGPSLLVTPLTLGVVPPPMSLFNLKFDAPICVVSFCKDEAGCLIAASLSNGAIGLLALPTIEKWDIFDGMESTVPNASFMQQTETIPCMRLMSWLDSTNVLGVVACAGNKQSVNSSSFTPPPQQACYSTSELLVEFEIHKGKLSAVGDGGCASDWSFKCSNRTNSDKRVFSLTNHPLTGGLLVHFEDGSFALYSPKIGLEPVALPKSLLHPSLWIEALACSTFEGPVVVGLDVKGKLQVDSHVITGDCTSFVIHNTYINGKEVIHMLHTTKQDILHINNLEEILGLADSLAMAEEVLDPGSKAREEPGFRYKNQGRKDFLKAHPIWERGARLVTAIGGHGAAVILQTVRGNLETIYPRNLIIGSIVAALYATKFNEAVLLARRHHISLSLIVDFRGWEAFVKQSVEFVKQVKDLNHVTELICAVSSGNTLDGIYRDLLLPYMKDVGNLEPQPSMDGQQQNPIKVKSVMRAIRKSLEDEVATSPKRELCILTTMARSDPPELEEALQCIKKLREEEINCLVPQEETDQSLKTLSAEEALKHLLWLTDSKSVFNAALGLYDLHLAALVAANSQGDPKEFLPLLQELEKMPPPLMKYTIDHKLERYESALRNLAVAGNDHFSRCLELIIDNPSLFPLGKSLFQEGLQRSALLEAWGDYLLAQERFEDAAAAFTSCSQLHKALGAYRAHGQWPCVFVIAGMLGFSQKEVLKLALELREELQAIGRPGDAGRIALDYCKEPEDAVQLFIEAREWMEAVRVAHMCEKPQSMKDHIEVAAIECAMSYTTEFEEGLEKVGKYLARYLAVKQRRVLLETKLKMGMLEDVDDDTASDVSSSVSGMSAYTTGTQSSRPSLQVSTISGKGRKQGGGKSRGGKIRAGSPGEETALVEHLKGMKITANTSEGIQKLLHILVLFGRNALAEKLQRLLLQFQSSQQKAVHETCENSGQNAIQLSQCALAVLGTSS